MATEQGGDLISAEEEAEWRALTLAYPLDFRDEVAHRRYMRRWLDIWERFWNREVG